MFGGDRLFDHLLTPVQRNFVFTDSNVTVISVRHFSGSVDDAAHDPDFEAFQVVGAFTNRGRGFLQVE